MIRDELDMLECRLIELEDYDVTHVLVEAPVTHRGDPKPLYFAESRGRFSRWKDRIRYVRADLPGKSGPPDLDPWLREHAQRDQAASCLGDAGPDDLVLIADVDEIPSRVVMESSPAEAVLLMQRVACFAVDWVWPGLEPTSVLVRAGVLGGRSLAAVRDTRIAYPAITDAGWHLSWLGGPEAQLAKLAAHCHQEQDIPVNLERITGGAAYREGWHIGVKLVPADVDETWPRYVYERRCPDSWFRPREEYP